jgi:hypothetical protein
MQAGLSSSYNQLIARPQAFRLEEPDLKKSAAPAAGGGAVGLAVRHATSGTVTGAQNSSTKGAALQHRQQGHHEDLSEYRAVKIRRLLQCAKCERDLIVCEGFNEALKQWSWNF